MKCPRCQHSLDRTRYAGANVRQCPSCKGLLLPKRRASLIQRRVYKDSASLASELQDIAEIDSAMEIRCPDCRDKMKNVLVEELSFCVDECDQCGMAWFDGGELAQLQLAFETKPQTRELNEMRDRLKNMSEKERNEYDKRIADLPDLGSPMEQAIRESTIELAARYYWLIR